MAGSADRRQADNGSLAFGGGWGQARELGVGVLGTGYAHVGPRPVIGRAQCGRENGCRHGCGHATVCMANRPRGVTNGLSGRADCSGDFSVIQSSICVILNR